MLLGEPAIDEPLQFRKRVDLDEIAVFDPTCVTNRPLLNFDAAVRAAKRCLENAQEFLSAIDVLRARKGRIRPLPDRVERQDLSVDDAMPGAPSATALSAPDILAMHTPLELLSTDTGKVAETPATRLDRWRRRLLDLSLRNRLLNFRDTNKTIPLLCPDLPALENALADGVIFYILPRPHDLSESDPVIPRLIGGVPGRKPSAPCSREQLRAKRLHADLLAAELDRRLLEVYRAARMGIEEGGASALYLALGFLAWYETPQSSQRRLAPILLFPLELHRRSAREGFTLRLSDEEPRLNMTLLELLKEDFSITVPGLEPLPEDDSGLDVRRIIRAFRETIRDIDRWDILDIARIGTFSFAKFLMWRDLAERANELIQNPVVGHLVNRPEQAFDPDATFPNPDRLDEEWSPVHAFCPLPADASQLAAILAAAKGRSFVLEGPPGTGKSQTITNLIAHCLAEGKTVLFVSEKMAALNVVHDRLQKVGLGRYCLELHSNKAHRQHVLAQLGDALGRYDSRPLDEWEREARRLESLRTELNTYVETLHRPRSTGDTVFRATSQLIGLRDVPRVELCWPSSDALDAEAMTGLRDTVERLATVATALGDIANHPWEAVRRANWTPVWEDEARRAIDRLRHAVQMLEDRAREMSGRVSLGDRGWSVDELILLDELAGVLLNSPALPTTILVQPDWDAIESRIRTWMERGRRRDVLRAEVFERFTEKILALNLDALQQRLKEAEKSWWPRSWWHRRSVWQEINSTGRDGHAITTTELALAIEQARLLRQEEQALTAVGDEARPLLGKYWQDGETEWGDLKSISDWARGFRSLAAQAAGDDFELAAALRERWARLATEGRDLLQLAGSLGVNYRHIDQHTKSSAKPARL